MGGGLRPPLVRQTSETKRQVLSRQESGSSRGVPDPSASLDAIHPPDRSSPSDMENGITSGSVSPLEPPSNQVSPRRVESCLCNHYCHPQVSPPPSYHDIPGTVPAHQGVSRGPPPSYEEAVDPNGESFVIIIQMSQVPLHCCSGATIL